MVTVVFLLTAAVLTLVQARMRIHVREDLVSTLRGESALYSQIEMARSDQAQESAVLIANQSSLKALMSTNDRSRASSIGCKTRSARKTGGSPEGTSTT
jgi:hypothetical protein